MAEDDAITIDNAVASGWLAKKGNRNALAILSLITLGSFLALAVDLRFVYLLVYLWFGAIYGIFLQYGRFCMASAVRDLFAIGVPRMAVGVMLAIVLYSLVAAVVKTTGLSTFHAHPLGWHILIGAGLFGFGIVFTGGCASSSLYKSGEGNIGSMLVLVAISFSQAIFVALGNWSDALAPASWTQSALEKGMPEELSVDHGWFDQFLSGYVWNLHGSTVSDSLGMKGTISSAFIGNALLSAIIPALVIIIVLYFITYRKSYLRRNKIDSPTSRDHLKAIWSMLTASRNTAIAGLALGFFAGLHMYTIGALRDHYGIFNFGELLADMGYRSGLSIQDTVFDPGYWYITTQEAQWGGWIMHQFGAQNMDNIFFGLDYGLPSPLLNAPGFMSIGIILGAAMIALWRGEFKWKVPSLETAIFAIAGGTLMGIGARIAMGCNIGAFFATVTNGDPSGWIFLAGMAIGGYLGVKVFTWWIDRQAAQMDGLAL